MNESKPKVLILLDRLVIGGQAVDVISLCYYLEPYFEVHLAYGQKKASDGDANFLLEIYSGLRIHELKLLSKTFNPIKNVFAYFEIKRLIKSINPHIVHTNAVKSGFFGRFAASRLKISAIVHTFHGHFFHSYFNWVFTKTLITIERRLSVISHTIVATSNAQAHDIAYKYNICELEKVKVVELGLDDYFFEKQILHENSLFREVYDVKTDVIKIAIIARIVKVKNFNMFVEVVKKVLQKTKKRVQFFVIGDGELKKSVQQQLTNYHITWCEKESFTQYANVVFTSWMPHIYSLLQALDIVILTSNNEGTGLSLAESQLSGKPVVATCVGGVPDTIINEKTGFLVPNNDVNLFSEKLLSLIEDNDLRTKMGDEARIFAKKKFSKENEVFQIVKLYNQLLKRTRIS